MRILVDSVAARSGGGVTVLEGLGQGLVGRSEAEVRLIVDTSVIERVAESIGRSALIGISPGSRMRRLIWGQLRLPSIAYSGGFDVLFGLTNQLPLFLGKRRMKTALLIQNIAPLVPEIKRMYSGKWRLRLEALEWVTRRSIRAADVVFLFSAYGRRLVEALEPAARVRTVAPGGFPAGPVLDEHSSKSDYVVLVAELVAYKGVEDALRALVQPQLAGVRLKVCGNVMEPDYAARLREQVHALRLQDRVDFLGHVPRGEVLRLIRGSICLVNTSRVESLGLPLLEALSVGTQVVSSDIPVARELCGDLPRFYLPGDAAKLAELISEVRKGGASREWQQRAFAHVAGLSWARTAEQMVGHIADL